MSRPSVMSKANAPWGGRYRDQSKRAVQRRKDAAAWRAMQNDMRFLGTGYYGSSGSELKFFDTTKASTTVANTGTILDLSLNLIAAGTGENDRDGRKASLTQLYLRGEIKLPNTAVATNASERVRFIVYIDKQCNGATAAVTDILETAVIDSHYNLANQQRFKLLTDRVYDISAQAPVGSVSAQTIKTLYLNRKLMLPVEFSSTTGAITELRSNNIGVLAISSIGVGAVEYVARVRFRG